MPKRPKALAAVPRRPAILSAVASTAFAELHVSAALNLAATARTYEEWFPLCVVPDIRQFEFEHAVAHRRWPYNGRCFIRARRERSPVIGEHAGFCDLFLPVGDVAGAWGTLVVGPFATSRPTSGDVLSRWRWLSGSHGRLGDPAFARYLSTTLSTLTVEAKLFADFRRFIVALGRLFRDERPASGVAAEIAAIRPRLLALRAAERMWEAARSMVDERTTLQATIDPQGLSRLGLRRVPQHAVVGLLRGLERDEDPVDHVIRRDSFQRACVDFATRRGGVVCARVGDHGVALLSDDVGSGPRLRGALEDIGQRVSGLARRFGLRAHLGISAPTGQASPPARYQMALSAAEKALSLGRALVHAEAAPRIRRSMLGSLRRELGQTVSENAALLSPRFQQYVDAAATHCGYRIEPTRAHLDAAIDDITDVVLTTGAVDERSFAETRAALETDAVAAATVGELATVYRTVVADIEHALLAPQTAQHGRSVRRAVAFIRDHLAEPLSLAKLSQVAGFGRHYFSRLFRQQEGQTLKQHIRRLRIERAKSMLRSTTLSVERVGRLSGLGTRANFQRTFKEVVGTTPRAFRRRTP